MENQDTGISALISACRAGVVTDTGPKRATCETEIIGTFTVSFFDSTMSLSPSLRSRAPGVCT